MSVLKKNDHDLAFNGYGRREKYEKTSGKYCLDLRNIIGFYVKWLRKENSRCNRRHNCHSGEQQCGRDNHGSEGKQCGRDKSGRRGPGESGETGSGCHCSGDGRL